MKLQGRRDIEAEKDARIIEDNAALRKLLERVLPKLEHRRNSATFANGCLPGCLRCAVEAAVKGASDG